MPLLSIIVPVYNSKNYLATLVNSILSQILNDFELLLIDDGSKDGSGELCDQIALTDNRITAVHQQTQDRLPQEIQD